MSPNRVPLNLHYNLLPAAVAISCGIDLSDNKMMVAPGNDLSLRLVTLSPAYHVGSSRHHLTLLSSRGKTARLYRGWTMEAGRHGSARRRVGHVLYYSGEVHIGNSSRSSV